MDTLNMFADLALLCRSALDTQSEKVVQDALENIRHSRKLTTVSVAHRLTTIINSDQIAVIDDGAIQELGTHKELFEEGGIYAQLCEAQGITADTQDAVESKKDGVADAAAGTTATPEPTKDEQPSGNPDDVEAGVVAVKGEGDKPEDEEMAAMERLWQYNKPEGCYMVRLLLLWLLRVCFDAIKTSMSSLCFQSHANVSCPGIWVDRRGAGRGSSTNGRYPFWVDHCQSFHRKRYRDAESK